MGLVVLGVILLLCKSMGWLGMQDLSWWWVLAPFGGAVLWWSWSDSSGRTAREAMKEFDEKREKRRQLNMEQLGLKSGPKRRR